MKMVVQTWSMCWSKVCTGASYQETYFGGNKEYGSSRYQEEKFARLFRKNWINGGVQIEFDVASNPEFWKEGAAISDFMSPDRVVVGTSRSVQKSWWPVCIVLPLQNNFRVIFMDVPSAEMTKYAANAMLATVSVLWTMGQSTRNCRCHINMVRKGIGSDNRIGNRFHMPVSVGVVVLASEKMWKRWSIQRNWITTQCVYCRR